MADLSKIKLPDNTIYDIRDANKSGCYTVIGTQTESTSAWTGSIPIPHLYTGLSIDYYLPCDSASSGVTLNLTLSDGATTGGTQCYINPDTVATSQCKAGQVIHMTYYSAGSISINGSTIASNRWIFDSFPECQDIIDENVAILEATPGAICSFSNAAPGIDLNSLKVAITAKQSGSGTPAPDNIRPISGWSECNVVRCGKNLLDSSLLIDQIGWNVINLNLKPLTQYAVSSNMQQSITNELPLYAFSTSQNPGSGTLVYSGHSVIITTNEDGILKIQQRRVSGTDSFANYHFQIELGSTATDYEPYVSQTYTKTFNACYGGKLNFTTGALEVTHEVVDLGSLNWVISSNMFINSDVRTVIKPATSNANPINGISSLYTITSYNGLNDMCLAVSTAGNVFIKNSAYTDAASFKTAMNGVQLVYELATPFTIQLSPQQVAQLLGDNNVWADTGDVEELKYYTDSQAIQTINALSKQNNTDTIYTGTGVISVDSSTHVISSTAEVNQNAFSNIKVGNTSVAADAKMDTLELVSGDNITLTPDSTNDKITIASANDKVTQTEKDLTTADTTWREVLTSSTSNDYITKTEGTVKTQKIVTSVDKDGTYYRIFGPEVTSDATTNKVATMQIYIPKNPVSGTYAGLASFEVGVQSGSKVSHAYRSGTGYSLNVQKFGPNKDIYYDVFSIDETTGDITLGDRVKALLGVKDILWQNENPTSAFAAGTINVANLSDYGELIIDYIGHDSTGTWQSMSVPSACYSQSILGIYGNSNVFYRRLFTISEANNQITWQVGQSCSTYGSSSWSTDNVCCVPYRIWGWNPPVYISS